MLGRLGPQAPESGFLQPSDPVHQLNAAFRAPLYTLKHAFFPNRTRGRRKSAMLRPTVWPVMCRWAWSAPGIGTPLKSPSC
jgi:hypothetical protein